LGSPTGSLFGLNPQLGKISTKKFDFYLRIYERFLLVLSFEITVGLTKEDNI
jgi:hypothetical protein